MNSRLRHIGIAFAAIVGGCTAPRSSAPPPPPQGWVMQSEIEEPVPVDKGFETTTQVLDEYISLIGRIPGAIQDVRRGERWAVLDIDAAAMGAGMAAKAPDQPPPPAPGQLRLFVSQNPDGAFTITQTMYSAPLGGRSRDP